MLPEGSIKKLAGIDCTPYKVAASLFQNFRSLACVHVKPSFLIASCQAPFSWSSETPNTVKFLSLNWLYAFTTFGFSMRHGLHQLAQKSTSTYFPLKEANDTGLPFTSGCINSGAFLIVAAGFC